MIKFKNILITLLASLTLTLGLGVAHADETPDVLVKRISQEVLDIAKNDKDIKSGSKQKILDLVQSKIIPYIDFQRMTELAVGRNWRVATPAQQKDLVKQFSSLLVYSYAGALSTVSDQRLEYKPFRAAPTDTEVEVRSQIVSSRVGDPIQINYRLAKGADGWKIYDFNVAGAWLIENYKGSFSDEISKNGIDGLIATLTAKNAKLAVSFAKK